MSCTHEYFEVSASVARLTDVDNGPIKNYLVEITVKCRDCSVDFSFVGLPGGVNTDHPCVNIDGTELRAPIVPVERLLSTPKP